MKKQAMKNVAQENEKTISEAIKIDEKEIRAITSGYFKRITKTRRFSHHLQRITRSNVSVTQTPSSSIGRRFRI